MSHQEVSTRKAEHFAGTFAAKEAVIKALSMKPGSWKDIVVKKTKESKPFVDIVDSSIAANITSSDLSIRHDGDYAVAIFVAIVKN